MLIYQRFWRLRFSKKICTLKCNVTFWWSVALIHWEMVLVRTKLNREYVVYPSGVNHSSDTLLLDLVHDTLLLELDTHTPHFKSSSSYPLCQNWFPYPLDWNWFSEWVDWNSFYEPSCTDYHNDHITSLYSNTRRYRRFKQPSG